jgi:hypothetical protein
MAGDRPQRDVDRLQFQRHPQVGSEPAHLQKPVFLAQIGQEPLPRFGHWHRPPPPRLGLSGRRQFEPHHARRIEVRIGQPTALAGQAEGPRRVLTHDHRHLAPVVDPDDLVLVRMIGQRLAVQPRAAGSQDVKQVFRVPAELLVGRDMPVPVQEQSKAAFLQPGQDRIPVAQVLVVQIAGSDEVMVQGRDPQPRAVRVQLLAPLDRRLRLGDADPAVVVFVAFRFADARIQRGDQRLVLGQGQHVE